MSDEIIPSGEFLLYTSNDGRIRLEVRMQDETIWLTQQMMADLFGVDKSGISRHLRNIFQSGELQQDSVVANFATTAADGKVYQVEYYNLDAIISVGYRVNSIRGTQFRMWATQRLREYIIKGFTLDDERLKNPPVPGATPLPDHFDELLERIRDIRSSERRMYLRIKDIFAMAADYVPSSKESVSFFRTIQNKLHYAITGHTAAELISKRADATQPSMGLTSWMKDKVHPSDVTVVKNYLKESEIDDFNRLTSLCLDFIEDQAKNRRVIFLREWEGKVNELLKLMGRKILTNTGRVSKKKADQHAREQYDILQENRRIALEKQAEQDFVHDLESNIKYWKTKNAPENHLPMANNEKTLVKQGI